MTRILLLTSVVSGVAAAQVSSRLREFPSAAFTGLTTNRDGSMLLFSSPLRLKNGGDQVAWEKLFAWTAKDGVQLFAQRSNTRFLENSRGRWDGLDYYHLLSPSLSSDGRTVTFTGQNDCTWGTPCATSRERWESTVRLPDGTERTIAGSVRLSANGRFALAQSSRPWGQELAPDVTWLDVRTGQSVVSSFVRLPMSGSRPVADDGWTVRRMQGELELWRPGFDPFRPTEVKPLTGLRDSSGVILLSSDAKVVVAHVPSGLVVYEVATGQVTRLSSSTDTSATDASALDVSEDGSVVLFRDAAAYRVVRRDSSGFRDLPLTGTVNESVLSGDGKAVFAVVDGSRIIKIEVETGRVVEVVPSTPHALAWFRDPISGLVARGSLLRIANTWLGVQRNLPGGPAIAARFGGQTWPVITSDADGTTVQVPWEVPVDTEPNYLQLTLKGASESNPFEAAWIFPIPLKVQAVFPTWFIIQPSPTTQAILAAHEDFRSLVSPSSPARGGEVIHAYGTGFGEVTPAVPTGQVSPEDPLSRVAGNLECSLSGKDGPVPVEVLFSGLAPGLTGVYQIDVRMPMSLPENVVSEVFLTCRIGEAAVGERIAVMR